MMQLYMPNIFKQMSLVEENWKSSLAAGQKSLSFTLTMQLNITLWEGSMATTFVSHWGIESLYIIQIHININIKQNAGCG
jgi:hypothetical protein